MTNKTVFMSPPDVTQKEIDAVVAAMKSGWVAPLGPEVDAFESEFAQFCGTEFAVALSSGTAAIHLGLLALGVQPGDKVVVPTLTFAATAFATTYTGAIPVFIDSRLSDWNLDTELLENYLSLAKRKNDLPKAIVPVDLFGRTCDYDEINEIASRYGVLVLSDSAESLGASYKNRPSGSLAPISAFSFNGNKIITTSGGGMVTTNSKELADRVKFLSTQARQPVPWYEHHEIGFNYRLSNILAAIGRTQLSRLPEILQQRRTKHDLYLEGFENCKTIQVIGDIDAHSSNNWLTNILIDIEVVPDGPEKIRARLSEAGIESRHAWKPMHQQEVFINHEHHLTGVADRIFERGLCLPSGQNLTPEIQEKVIELVLSVAENS